MVKRFKKEIGKQLVYESYDKLLELWDMEKDIKEIPTAYGVTNIITAGEAKDQPLLLFHGVGDNSALMWIYNIKELAKRFYVIAIDTIGGSGKSEPNEAYFKNFEQSAWINEILDKLGIDKVFIAGVSYGAYLACHYLIKNPERVLKIVCMAGGVRTSLFRMMTVFLPEALFPTEKNIKKLLRKLSGPNFSVFEKNEELLKHWRYLLKYFNNQSMFYHKIAKFNKEELLTLKGKSLFLIGEYDKLSNYPKSIKSLSDNGLLFKIIKDAGHGINHEQAELINNEIVSFLLG
jgi:pimeloyl-ACP methyl ester carboxylesterase